MERHKRMDFVAKGTTCNSCAEIIKRQAKKVHGVHKVDFDYATESGHVVFDESKTDIDKILDKIEEKGYECFILEDACEPGAAKGRSWGWVFIAAGVLIAALFAFRLAETINMPRLDPNMGYGLLFAVGLLTGFHCVSMCGGFVLAYTTKDSQEGRKPYRSHALYAIGKTLSYTIIGAAFGLLGSIVTFTPFLRGAAGLIAGLFLILFGLKMLNVVPSLRKLSIRTPGFVTKFVARSSLKTSSPLMIGLLNGLMIACGPLQAIYVMAAGTGSMIEGGKLLLVFGLGTLPVMLGFGYFASFISSKATNRILKASGALVIIMGLLMLNNGLALTGTGYDFNSVMEGFKGSSLSSSPSDPEAQDGAAITMKDGYQEIRMDVTRYGWEPDRFVLKKGVPVRWIINGKEITTCNNAIQVPSLGLKFDIKPGEQVIEFTPNQEGTIPFSCWMGMIPGTFIVKEDIDLADDDALKQELDSIPAPVAGSCGMGAGGGGCGCGARKL